MAFLKACLTILALVCVSSAKHRQPIKLGALLPYDDARMFSRQRLMPAGHLAIKELHKQNILTRHKISVIVKNSNCSEALGMNEAINFFIRGDINVFFGPVCDFAAAPVVRQMTFWKLPLVSIGAFAQDFLTRRQTVYPMLTRAGPTNLGSLVRALVSFGKRHEWSRFMILYEQEGHREVVPMFCHLATEVLITGIPQAGISVEYSKLMPGKDPSKILVEKVGNKHSGNFSDGEIRNT